jgi:hypothetical protein
LGESAADSLSPMTTAGEAMMRCSVHPWIQRG